MASYPKVRSCSIRVANTEASSSTISMRLDFNIIFLEGSFVAIYPPSRFIEIDKILPLIL